MLIEVHFLQPKFNFNIEFSRPFDLQENHFGTKFNKIGHSAAHYTMGSELEKFTLLFFLLKPIFTFKIEREKKSRNGKLSKDLYRTFSCAKKLYIAIFSESGPIATP